MNLGKKLATLINATLRSGFSRPRRKLKADGDDPASVLEALRRQLADVEAKERELADLLKATHAKAESARDEGRPAEADTQTRLAAELEAQLDTQSTQAIALSNKVKAMKAALEAKSQAEQQAAGEPSAPSGGDAPSATEPPSPAADDADLSARKSRLSD